METNNLTDAAYELVLACEEHATVLEAEAATLTSEDAAERRQMKEDAAIATRLYARDLRGMADLGRVTATDLDRGRLIALAASMGGWLSDSSRMQGAYPARQAKLRALEAAGFAEHVAEEHQVPYFRLRAAEATGENTDEA